MCEVVARWKPDGRHCCRTVAKERPMNSPDSSVPEIVESLDASAVIEQDDLVEEVSIDGMCGVY
jgi:mycofactocin precursor